MTKYKFKIDTPWGKKGDELTVVRGSLGQWFKPNNPQDYPELFEEVKEKTNEEKIAKVIKNEYLNFIEVPRYMPYIHSDYLEFFKKLPEILDRLGFNADTAYNEICGDKK